MSLKKLTDKYFSHTKKIIEKKGDNKVIYAFFLRSDAMYAPKPAFDFIAEHLSEKSYKIITQYQEGDIVKAGEVLFFLEGNFTELVELETLILQKIGLPCICAYNSYRISLSLKQTPFMAMEARHTSGKEMLYLTSYGCALGSKMATKEGAKGFIGTSVEEFCHLYTYKKAMGTMPHALIGYCKSTLHAAKLYYEYINNTDITVLVDYFGQEIHDSLEVAKYFAGKKVNLSVRIDTSQERFVENLNEEESIKILQKHGFNLENIPLAERIFLIGKGVSVAATYYLRDMLDSNNFANIKITVSSGFGLEKCEVFNKYNAPINMVGTGSFLPHNFRETFATADIISYNGEFKVKKGREHLITGFKSLNEKK